MRLADTSGWAVAATMLLALVLITAPTLVHELGHAVAARGHGIRVGALVAMPEGPSITWTRRGLTFRVGLGLLRDMRSREPAGWVEINAAHVNRRAARQVLLAGPAAEGAFGVLLLAGATLSLPLGARICLVVTGIECIWSAVYNLVADGNGQTDGAQLRMLRTQVDRPPLQRYADPNRATSVAPPESE